MVATKKRPTWDEYFLSIAKLTQKRSTCLRRQVGAVLTKDNHVISTGYSGAPKDSIHCTEAGCQRATLDTTNGKHYDVCRSVHAEQNAIIQAAFFGSSTNGSVLYSTHQPCVICAKILINAGVKKVVYIEPYSDDMARTMMTQAGIELVQMDVDIDESAV